MPCCLGQPKSKAIWPNFRRPTFTLLISLYCRTVLNLLDELRIGAIHTKKNWVGWPSQLHKSVYFVVLDWHLQPSRLVGRGYQCSHRCTLTCLPRSRQVKLRSWTAADCHERQLLGSAAQEHLLRTESSFGESWSAPLGPKLPVDRSAPQSPAAIHFILRVLKACSCEA